MDRLSKFILESLSYIDEEVKAKEKFASISSPLYVFSDKMSPKKPVSG